MPSDNELEAYKLKVIAAMQRAKTSGSPSVFENKGPAHARVVLEVMLADGERSVDVLTGVMDSAGWEEKALLDFLSRHPEGRIRVLFDQLNGSELPENSVLKKLIRHTHVETGQLMTPFGTHLCIVDNKHVRLEYNHDIGEANITFGDPEAAERATAIFETLWNSEQRIDLVESKQNQK